MEARKSSLSGAPALSPEAITSSHEIIVEDDSNGKPETSGSMPWWQMVFVITRPTYFQNLRENVILTEISGAFGDLGTFIPLTVALAEAGCIDFAAVLFYSGTFLHCNCSKYFRSDWGINYLLEYARCTIYCSAQEFYTSLWPSSLRYQCRCSQ